MDAVSARFSVSMTFAKYNLLRKCGLLAHTSAAFLKNCCTEKLFSSKRRCFPCHFFIEKNLPLLPLFLSLRNGNSIGISPCSDRTKLHSNSIGSFAMLFRLLTLL